MSFEIHWLCERCGTKIMTPGEDAGRVVKCPACGTKMQVPGALRAQPAYERDSNVERLAGWGLWYVYWKLFSWGCSLLFLAVIVAWLIYAYNHPEEIKIPKNPVERAIDQLKDK
jgi:DNA-directed RNA polymerase subunit RPC12/RpoP